VAVNDLSKADVSDSNNCESKSETVRNGMLAVVRGSLSGVGTNPVMFL
jgi:hypothetical protein